MQIEFSPDWPEEARHAAAGTFSIMDAHPAEWVVGYQLLTGVDRVLSERTSMGGVVRWTVFGDVRHNAPHETKRSHAPVQADSVTPWRNALTFSEIGYMALSVNLKYHF